MNLWAEDLVPILGLGNISADNIAVPEYFSGPFLP